ncbi:MAG: adenine deaminase [Dehalococcoidales bacterium]|jgi:adenine deaminase|nr:adenine deaminase [Dehalococcoidales bacterium]
MSDSIVDLISVAKGDAPADLVFTNAKIVNVFSGEIESGNVAVYKGRIAGVGDYNKAKKVIDLKGKYLAPGLINGHTHIESSMLDIGQYAKAVVSRGTTAVVTDLHELTNVCGLDAIRYILGGAEKLPLDLFLMAPSCVPATNMETSGANITSTELRRIMRLKNVIGLGEMMNFPGVIYRDGNVLDKIKLYQDKIIDGHSPGLSGKDLNAYMSAGIYSDHECVSLAEAAEKLKRGMHIMIREGSSEKNLKELLPLVTDKTYKRCMFVVDDRSCSDLLNDGDIDAVVRKAIRLGLEPVRAIQLATINTAEYFGLKKTGAIAPGYMANLITLNNLSDLDIDMVFYKGKPVAGNGKALFDIKPYEINRPTDSVRIKPFKVTDLKLKAKGDTGLVIEIVPGQIVTKKKTEKVQVKDGCVCTDTERDILKLVVVERHHASGNIGKGLIKGLGLKRGALATSVGHDSHNVIAAGTNDEDIYIAIKEIERLQGGLTVVADGKVLGSLQLSIGGLMSVEPLETVSDKLQSLKNIAAELGATLPDTFATLSFMALPVIPELRLTDLGLVDVTEFKLVE